MALDKVEPSQQSNSFAMAPSYARRLRCALSPSLSPAMRNRSPTMPVSAPEVESLQGPSIRGKLVGGADCGGACDLDGLRGTEPPRRFYGERLDSSAVAWGRCSWRENGRTLWSVFVGAGAVEGWKGAPLLQHMRVVDGGASRVVKVVRASIKRVPGSTLETVRISKSNTRLETSSAVQCGAVWWSVAHTGFGAWRVEAEKRAQEVV
jgi:hypothetical protein